MIKKTILIYGLLCFLLVGANQAPAAGGQNKGGNNECPVDLVSGMTLDEEFGPGSSEITHCLKRRHNVKLVVQVNNYCGKTNAAGECIRPYALKNIDNVIKDYEITNGMERGRDYEIAAIVHSGGGRLMLDDTNMNDFISNVENLMADGVKFYFCQNTVRGMGLTTDQIIPGVEYVTAGISALADFQSRGYKYVQP